MSRVGNKPIPILDGVKVSLAGSAISVEGPKGKLSFEPRAEVRIEIDEGSKEVKITRKNEARESRAFHGLTRALLNNMIIGVKDGYEKKLDLQGVGYVAQLQGNQLTLRVGYANEVKKTVPAGLEVTCPDQTHIHVKGCDKQLVGQFAAEIRAVRKPEPYKGKGVRYEGEHIKLKPGKAAS